MVSFGKAVLFGFLIWLIAFVVAVAIFPIRESWRALFESIMPVVVAVATVTFAVRYVRNVRAAFLRECALLGALWFAINVLIDLPLMLTGPMKMTLVDYAADVGLTYLIIPVITIGIGLTRAQAGRSGDGNTNTA
jgi:hypothetical protein